MSCEALKQLDEDEEAEFEREELAQQNELRAMLCNALDADDLLDDEDEGVEENVPKDHLSMYSQDNSIADEECGLAWQFPEVPQPAAPSMQQQTSTPRNVDALLPALHMPSTEHSGYFRAGLVNEPNMYQHDELSLSQDGFEGFQEDQFLEQDWPTFQRHRVRQQDTQYYYEDDCNASEKIVHHVEDIGQVNCVPHSWQGRDGQHNSEEQLIDNHVSSETHKFGFDAHVNQLNDQKLSGNSHILNHQSDHQETFHSHVVPMAEEHDNTYTATNINPAFPSSVFDRNLLPAWQRQNDQPPKPVSSVNNSVLPVRAREIIHQSAADFNDGHHFRVHYKQTSMVNDTNSSYRQATVNFEKSNLDTNHTVTHPSMQSEVASDRLQHDFLHSDEDSMWSERETQMRVLLDAKTHKIEELSSALSELKESYEREMRILKHQFLMTKDEKDGLSQTIHQSELLIQEKQTRENQLLGQIAALKSELSMLQQTKEDMVKKIMTLESMVDCLTSQLSELGSNEALSKARQQHEAVVEGLRQKMAADAVNLNKKIDDMTQQLINKEDLLIDAKKQISDLEKIKKSMLQEHAEEINRLLRSLKQSQQECRDLLEAQGSQEFSKMKLKLQSVEASKLLTDELNCTLQTELQELREQVRMYEMLSQYSGVVATGIQTPRPNNGTLDDSYAQLAIKKTAQATTQQSSTGNNNSLDSKIVSADDAVHGLKSELERCLKKCREKSLAITKLQTELKTYKSAMERSNVKLEETEHELNQTKSLIKQQESSTATSASIGKQLEAITRENSQMKLQIEELQHRLTEMGESESHVTELNMELNHQIQQLISERASENSDNTLIPPTSQIRQSQLEQEIHDLQHQAFQFCDQINQLQEELMSTKELYMEVCKAKEKLEDELQYVKNDLTYQQQNAELLNRELIDKEISMKVFLLSDTHEKQMKAIEQNYMEKLASANQENLVLSETVRVLKTQISDVESHQKNIKKDMNELFANKLSELKSQHKLEVQDIEMQSEAKLSEVKKQHAIVVTDLQELYKRSAAELDRVVTDNQSKLKTLESENVELKNKLENLTRQSNHQRLLSNIDSESQRNSLLLQKTRLEERLKSVENCMEKANGEKRDSLESNRRVIEELETRVNDLSSKLSEANRNADDSLSKLTAVESCLEKTECEKRELLESSRQVIEELEKKVGDLSLKLLEANQNANDSVLRMQESLEREHAMVVDELKSKLSTKLYKENCNPLQEENVASAEKMKLMAEEIRSQYITAMEKMKAAVLSHSRETTRYYTDQLNEKLAKDRQVIARSLRSYYLRCLAKLLDVEFDQTYKVTFLKRMERLLDNLPEKDLRNATKCPTPSIVLSNVNSPRNLVLGNGSGPSKPTDVPRLALSDSSSSSGTGESCYSTPRTLNIRSTVAQPSGSSNIVLNLSQQQNANGAELTLNQSSLSMSDLYSLPHNYPLVEQPGPSEHSVKRFSAWNQPDDVSLHAKAAAISVVDVNGRTLETSSQLT